MIDSLNDILNSITNYEDLLKKYNYVKNEEGGDKPWSFRYDHDDGTRIEFRSSEWTYYLNGVEITMGKNAETLKKFLEEIK